MEVPKVNIIQGEFLYFYLHQRGIVLYHYPGYLGPQVSVSTDSEMLIIGGYVDYPLHTFDGVNQAAGRLDFSRRSGPCLHPVRSMLYGCRAELLAEQRASVDQMDLR